MPFDAHCHVVKDISHLLNNDNFQYCAIMGTHPVECQQLLTLPTHNHILIGLGFHPWQVDQYEYNESHYIQQIESNKFNFIGEIGVDKVATNPSGVKYDFNKQKKIFTSLFLLACKYQLPVSIHCARAYGYLFDFLKSLECINDNISNRQRKKMQVEHYDLDSSSSSDNEELAIENHVQHMKQCKSPLCQLDYKITPRIMLHSYSGSPETTQQLLNLSFSNSLYFSFSAIINKRSVKKFEYAMRNIPINRILLESDIHIEEELIPLMNEIVDMVATTLKLNKSQVIDFALHNGKEFYNIEQDS